MQCFDTQEAEQSFFAGIPFGLFPVGPAQQRAWIRAYARFGQQCEQRNGDLLARPVRAAERYSGPWNRRTAKPILVVNNTVDPETPYKGAVAMTRYLARARLLTVEGYGHSVLLNPSPCAQNHESSYFVEGALPPPGSVCQQKQQPFTTSPAP